MPPSSFYSISMNFHLHFHPMLLKSMRHTLSIYKSYCAPLSHDLHHIFNLYSYRFARYHSSQMPLLPYLKTDPLGVFIALDSRLLPISIESVRGVFQPYPIYISLDGNLLICSLQGPPCSLRTT